VDDVSKRVFELARGCIDELEKQKQYIQLLEEYIEELESGVEVSAVKPVQLEQLLEMERANDNMDDRRPSVMRRRNAKGNKRTAGSVSDSEHGTDDSNGGSGSTEVSIDNINAG
jgi:hypothetical protein